MEQAVGFHLDEGLSLNLVPRPAWENRANAQEMMGILLRLRNSTEEITNAMVARDADIGKALPGADTKKFSSNAGGFIYRLSRPCQCCGQGSLSQEITWSVARGLLGSSAIARIKRRPYTTRVSIDQDLVLDHPFNDSYVCGFNLGDHRITFGGGSFPALEAEFAGNPKGILPQRGVPEALAICPECSEKIVLRVIPMYRALREQQEAEHQAEIEAEQRRENEEADRRAAWEKKNPPYLVLVGDLCNIAAHNTEVNARLRTGYTVWVHPVCDNGNIAQTLVREDFLQKRGKINQKAHESSQKTGGRHRRGHDRGHNNGVF